MSSIEEKDTNILINNFSEKIANSKNTLLFEDVEIFYDKNKILNGVSGLATEGEMLAIMGPSGAGKSTLLNALSGRSPVSSGRITLNGEPVTKNIRHKISYVMQTDVFFPSLTLRETLTFASLILLPDKMPFDLKIRRMQEVVDALELTKCLNTKMGGISTCGLSGGEKKRASIAWELISWPSVLLIDEPTSGLDSAMASNLISTLEMYSRTSSQIIVTTIHQPSSQIFHQFTKVLLLTNGQVAYYGPTGKILDFFSSFGLHCNPNYNTADFILEQMSVDAETLSKFIEGSKRLRFQESNSQNEKSSVFNNDQESIVLIVHQTSQHSDNDISKQGDFENDYRRCRSVFNAVDIDAYKDNDAKWQTGFITQYMALTRRAFILLRSRFLDPLNLFYFVVAILTGMIFLNLERTEATMNDRFSLIFLFIAHNGFPVVTISALYIFDDYGVFDRERESGMYRVGAHLLAIMTSEIPFTFVLTSITTVILYWMGNFTPTAANFFGFWAICELHAFVSQSHGFALGVLIRDRKVVVTFAVKLVVLITLVGGFYNSHVPVWLDWISYLSFITYSFGALNKMEFLYGPQFACNPPDRTLFQSSCVNGTMVEGAEFLKLKNMSFRPLYADIVILFGFLVILRIIVYLVLLFCRRPNREN